MWWLLKGPTGHWDLTARADKTISKSLHPNARLGAWEGRGMVVGFKGVATRTRPSPSWRPFPKNTLSLILTLNNNNNIIIIIIIKIPYISANSRDIDTKLSGCVQIPKEHSVRHSDPQHQQQHHHHHHLHRHHHQNTSLLYPCIPYISVTFFEKNNKSLYLSQK